VAIDLNHWHHQLHQITGGMALRFNKATPADLKEWATALHTVAGEMEARAGTVDQHEREDEIAFP
jgi:endogenous inhibitor of DNA gyrase (YacG/DUF329 family)